MSTLKPGFTYELSDVVVREIAGVPVGPQAWNNAIPVDSNTSVSINTTVNNNIIYSYTLPVKFFYTDNEANTTVQIIEANLGIGPNTNKESMVKSCFPQYFIDID